MSRHTRTVVETFYLCDECGEECGNGFRTCTTASGAEVHACSASCQKAQDEKLMVVAMAVRRAKREQEAGGG